VITETQILQRVLVAALLGLVIGLDRERQDHSAGLRTHMILVIGAALAMMISINIAVQFTDVTPNGDPARLAAQVVSGIGFLGAGVIFRYGSSVRGLTTAASLWTMAIIGMAAGLGLFLAAAGITLIIFLILTLMNYVEDRYLATYNRLHITIWANDRPGLIDDVRSYLGKERNRLSAISTERDLDNQQYILDFHVRLWKKGDSERVMEEISKIEGLRRVKVQE
jgi:putative Mg2+ transporter-C (MgtC) family protein